MEKLKQYKEFLKYLSNKTKPSTYKDIMKEFNLNRQELERLFRHMQKYFDNVGHVKKREHDWKYHLIEINHQGVEYLRSLDIYELTKNQHKFNKVVALTGSIVAFTALWNYVDSLLEKNIGVPITATQLVSFLIAIGVTGILLFLLAKETSSIYFKK